MMAVTTNVGVAPVHPPASSGDVGLLDRLTLMPGAGGVVGGFVVGGLVVGAVVVGAVVGALVVGAVVGVVPGVALGVAEGVALGVAVADGLTLPDASVPPGSPVPVLPPAGADGPDAVVPVPPWLFDVST